MLFIIFSLTKQTHIKGREGKLCCSSHFILQCIYFVIFAFLCASDLYFHFVVRCKFKFNIPELLYNYFLYIAIIILLLIPFEHASKVICHYSEFNILSVWFIIVRIRHKPVGGTRDELISVIVLFTFIRWSV